MKKVLIFLVFMCCCMIPPMSFASVDSCVECDILLNGSCLANKYLPYNQVSTINKREWSAFQGNWFVKDNMIGVRFRLDADSLQTLGMSGFGLEVELVEKNSHKLKWTRVAGNLPNDSNLIVDTNALDSDSDTVYGVLIKNPENLDAYVDYYVWFYFESIPIEGVTIQPNLVVDIDSDCFTYHPLCYDVDDKEACEYFGMETDNFLEFVAYPDGRDGVCWSDKIDSTRPCVPSGYEIINGYVYISQSDPDLLPIAPVPEAEIEYFIDSANTSDPNDPDPTDPDTDPNIHINSLDIRFLGGSYVKEIQKTLYWGQSFQFEGRAEFENKSSQEAQDIDADYRITDSRSNFNEDATKIDEDGLFDISPGEREENSISPITVKVSDDGTKVSYSQGSMTKSFDVIDGFSKVYIFADIEVDGDKDISSPSDSDEYGKIELIIQKPPCQPNFTANPLSGVGPSVISFTNTSISNAADCVYTWSFGDGGTSNVYNPSYLYNNAGTFTPKLTANSYSYSYSGVKNGSTISIANPVPPSIVVTNPISSDKWRSDSSSHYIKWGYYNFPNRGTVNIHYTYDGGATWRRIESSVTNDGSRRWYMCNSTTKDSGNSYVRVCSNEYGVCGTSQRFYIDHASGCK